MRTILLPAVALLLASPALAAKVGDVTRFQGARDNFIEGVGIVIGLDGTGDSSGAAGQALASFLSRRQIKLTRAQTAAGNVAFVLVQARLGPFRREGQSIDVTVSSMFDAKSLFGGQLVQTPLEGADGKVYAVAAGPVTVGGFVAAGQAAQVRQNYTLVGRIPNGGIVERELKWTIITPHRELSLLLCQPDVRTATRVAKAINELFPNVACALDAVRVRVRVPEEWLAEGKQVEFMARLVDIPVEPAIPSRVVLNERSGTIIAGGDITLGPVSISHGNLIVAISETPEVSQPTPFSRSGRTAVVPRTTVQTEEDTTPVVRIAKGTKVADMSAALNAVGISPRDMVVIFQMLKRAGALHAELVIE